MSLRQIVLKEGALEVRLLTLGATVQEVMLAGVPHSLCLGSADIEAYSRGMEYFGAIVGPVANRIAAASAVLGPQRLRFEANENGRTTLHSGSAGTHRKFWRVMNASQRHVTLSVDLPDGEGGFPGNRTVTLTYALEPPATLRLDIRAVTDAETFMNFANHSYWCLDETGSIRGHKLTIAADRYVPVDRTLIPEGQAAPVEGTAFDFRDGRVFMPEDEQEYDHNFCLADARGPLRQACRLEGQSGISMTIETTEPGLQVYDAARLDTSPWKGLHGAPYGAYAGVALEPQFWPDAPNRPGFPRINVAPGRAYEQTTLWRFSRG